MQTRNIRRPKPRKLEIVESDFEKYQIGKLVYKTNKN